MTARPTRAASFPELDEATRRRWSKFGDRDEPFFQQFLGVEIEDVRTDYCRMRLAFRKELEQPGGVVHGGAIASLLDTVVVPVVGQAYPRDTRFATVDMHVQFMAALIADDAVAEGWIVRRGRSTVFCESEAVAATTGRVIARSMLTYNVVASPAGNVVANPAGRGG